MSPPPVKAAFELESVTVRLEDLLPSKSTASLKHSQKYQTILVSVREVGIIEPLIVYRQGDGKYLLLDGHARVEALRELGHEEAICLVATDDETYTYNHKVNRVAPIQAVRMILKALNAGVPEDKLANALNLSLKTIQSNRNMLTGICPEALDYLKAKPVAQQTLRELKKVKPARQIEMAELMTSAGNYTSSYARALVMATEEKQLVDGKKEKKAPGVKPEDLARMEQEMRSVEKDFLLLEETYNRNVYNLTLVRGYLGKLLGNARVVRYLAQQHGELLTEFQRLVESNTGDDP